MIDINKVSFGYPGHGNLYSNLEFSLPQGNIYGLLGRNGSGKSTLIYLIAGLLRPRKGNILFMGDDTKKREPKTLSNIFILPEEFIQLVADVGDHVQGNLGGEHLAFHLPAVDGGGHLALQLVKAGLAQIGRAHV